MIRSILARIISVRMEESQVKRKIRGAGGEMDLIILRYGKGPGILWIHGGGYVLGMAEMVYYSMGRMLARKYGGVVVSPEYRLAKKAPYPAALKDCYTALKYMYDHADELGIDRKRIIVGGESAGGGLAAALCMYARDKGEVPVSFQISCLWMGYEKEPLGLALVSAGAVRDGSGTALCKPLTGYRLQRSSPLLYLCGGWGTIL